MCYFDKEMGMPASSMARIALFAQRMTAKRYPEGQAEKASVAPPGHQQTPLPGRPVGLTGSGRWERSDQALRLCTGLLGTVEGERSHVV